MDLLNNSRWAATVLGLILIVVAVFAAVTYDLYPSYIASTWVIIACGLLLLMRCSVFSFRVMSYVIIFFPALAPAYAFILRGKGLFSMSARHLQADPALIDKAVFLFAVAAVVYVIVAVQSLSTRITSKRFQALVIDEVNDKFLLFIAAMTIVSSILIEPGPTIITANYKEVLAGSEYSSPVVVFLKLMFGGFWGMLFVFGRRHKRLFWGVTIIVCLWLFLHVRRVEVFGIVLVLVLWKQHSMKRSILGALLVLFICAQTLIGQIRNHALLDYMHSDTDTVTEHISIRSGRPKVLQRKAAIPGGVSNIFLSYLHLVNEKDSGNLRGDQVATMLQWPLSIIPNTVWKAFGMAPTKNEHEVIYEELKLNYHGGMHLLGVFYLNGGIWLVILYGLLHGWLAREVDHVAMKNFQFDSVNKVTLSLFVVTVVLVYQFRYHWYNPQTLFRAVVYSAVAFLIVHAVARWGKAKRLSNEGG